MQAGNPTDRGRQHHGYGALARLEFIPLGDAALSQAPSLRNPQQTEYVPTLKACLRGHAMSCSTLGEMREIGIDMRRSDACTAALYRKAYDRSDPASYSVSKSANTAPSTPEPRRSGRMVVVIHGSPPGSMPQVSTLRIP